MWSLGVSSTLILLLLILLFLTLLPSSTASHTCIIQVFLCRKNQWVTTLTIVLKMVLAMVIFYITRSLMIRSTNSLFLHLCAVLLISYCQMRVCYNDIYFDICSKSGYRRLIDNSSFVEVVLSLIYTKTIYSARTPIASKAKRTNVCCSFFLPAI